MLLKVARLLNFKLILYVWSMMKMTWRTLTVLCQLSNGNVLERSWFTKNCILFYFGTQRPRTKTVTEELQKNKVYSSFSTGCSWYCDTYSCHPGITDCAFFWKHCGGSSYDRHHHLYQYHATFKEIRCHEGQVGYQNRMWRRILSTSSLDCRIALFIAFIIAQGWAV